MLVLITFHTDQNYYGKPQTVFTLGLVNSILDQLLASSRLRPF